jgi:hypothetical protein
VQLREYLNAESYAFCTSHVAKRSHHPSLGAKFLNTPELLNSDDGNRGRSPCVAAAKIPRVPSWAGGASRRRYQRRRATRSGIEERTCPSLPLRFTPAPPAPRRRPSPSSPRIFKISELAKRRAL